MLLLLCSSTQWCQPGHLWGIQRVRGTARSSIPRVLAINLDNKITSASKSPGVGLWGGWKWAQDTRSEAEEIRRRRSPGRSLMGWGQRCRGAVPPLLRLHAWGRALQAGCSRDPGSPTAQGCSCTSLSRRCSCTSHSQGCSCTSPVQRCFCMSPSQGCSRTSPS